MENSYNAGVITNHEILEFTYSIDSASLSIGSYNYYDHFVQDNQIIFIGYNSKTHSLDIINLTEGNPNGHIKLANDGPYGVLNIRGVTFISHDSILLADESKFCIINSKGSIIWKLHRKDPYIFGDLPLAWLNTNFDSFTMGLDASRGSFVLYYLPIDEKYYREFPSLIQIDFHDPKGRLLPVYTPAYPGPNPLYTGPRSCYKDELILINYTFSSDIHVYNRETQEVTHYGGRSKFTKNSLEPMAPDMDMMDYINKNVHFYKLIYDPYRNLYYRTHLGEMPLKKSEYEFNTFKDKPIYMTVFDGDLNCLYETRLYIESGIYLERLIPTPDGVLVFPLKQNEANLLSDMPKGYLIRFR